MTLLRVAEHFEASDTGRQRRANEDSHYARAPLFAVADGMGGAQAGEVASRTAVQTLAGAPVSEGPAEATLAERAQEANRAIHALGLEQHELAGMGTTLTMAHVGERELVVAHVGDSRAYLLRDGRLARLTRDHSLVGELVEQGRLTEEEAEEHPQRSIITRALGPEAHVEVDVSSHPARHGDVVLLCSDGLTSMVPERRLREILAGAASLPEGGRALIAAANEAGGRDNITVVLLRLQDASAEPEQPTQVGPAAPSARAVREAAAQRASPARTHPLPGPLGPPRRRRRLPLGALTATACVLAVVAVAGWIATRAIYFVGTDAQGAVTIYRGLPWEGPVGLRLYERFYSSGVVASGVPAVRRRRLLDHQLRSREDAEDLVAQLELGRLER